MRTTSFSRFVRHGAIALSALAMAGDGLAVAQTRCNTVQECAQQAVDQAAAAVAAIDRLLPRGSVVAFDLDACPAGWAPMPELAGRVIVGAGPATLNADGSVLTSPRKRGDFDGAERHRLTVAEMPAHSHSYTTSYHNQGGAGPGQNAGLAAPGQQTGSQGENHPHNIMQPFRVLTFCRRP